MKSVRYEFFKVIQGDISETVLGTFKKPCQTKNLLEGHVLPCCLLLSLHGMLFDFLARLENYHSFNLVLNLNSEIFLVSFLIYIKFL